MTLYSGTLIYCSQCIIFSDPSFIFYGPSINPVVYEPLIIFPYILFSFRIPNENENGVCTVFEKGKGPSYDMIISIFFLFIS